MFGLSGTANAIPGALAQPEGSDTGGNYTITAINEPSAGASALQGTVVFGINASGAVTGSYSDQTDLGHGFVCAAGGASCTSFDAPNAGTSPPAGSFQGTIGIGIDTAGDVVGVYFDSNNAYHGFLRNAATGTITEFDDPNAPTANSSRGTFPSGINDNGQIVGNYTTGSYNTASLYHGFVYSIANGSFTEIDEPDAGTGSVSSYQKEGTVPAAINASGAVTGYYVDASGERHGFIRSAAGNYTSFDGPGATTNTGKGGGLGGTIPLSIDAAGDVVGSYTDSNQIRHGFILPAGSTTPTSFDAPGANTASQSGTISGSFATSIDPTGSYVCGGYTDSSGLYHGFVYYLPLTSVASFTTFSAPDAATSVTDFSFTGTGSFGVNASGTAVGFYLDSNEVLHGFQYAPTATPAPTFSPTQGTYSAEQSVTISDTDSSAAIYYTTDGSTPTVNSTEYTDPITVSSTETINAIALDSSSGGYIESAVASATYTISASAPTPAATPTFSVPSGTYASAQTVTISDATTGATIYYTTDGTTPTTSSSQYTSPISVSTTETIEAIATASGYSSSAVASATYTISLGVTAAPTFSPAAGTYTSVQTVTISDSTTGASIYYTTNGTTPTTGSTVYSSPISVSSSETLEAIAAASGYSSSAVASAAYTINLPSFGAPSGSQPESISIQPGATTGNTATISVVGTNGFSGTVNLNCSITPVAANDPPTCALSPPSVTLSGATVETSTLTVSTTAATSTMIRPQWRPMGGTALGIILMLAIPRRRRRWLATLVLLTIAFSMGAAGCGGGSSSSSGNSGTTSGAYTITVTGTSGSTTATIAVVKLTVAGNGS